MTEQHVCTEKCLADMAYSHPAGYVEDGFGNVWCKCQRPDGCQLEVVRPGKVQCNKCVFSPPEEPV